MIRAFFVAALFWAAVSHAAPRATRSAMLPTRRSDAAALGARVEALAQKLDERRGAPHASPDAAVVELGPTLERASAMLAAGKVDDAAVILDLALDLGVRAPGRLANPGEFLHAHVTRAAVALARHETGQAEALLARALRYDPTFTLSSDESSPRVRAVFDGVARAVGSRPPLERRDLGELAQGRLLVGRAAAGGLVEVVLLDEGRPIVASVVSDDADALRRLEAADATAPLAASVPPPPAPAPGPSLSAPAPSPAATSDRQHRRRVWLWTLLPVSAVVVAGVITLAVVLTRPAASSSMADWNVEPHF